MKFIPLHIHSGYSFLNSGILFSKLINNAKLKGYPILGLSDPNTMYGYPSFSKECLKNNITPIFGLDILVNDNLFTLFAKNEDGYKNLCEISTKIEKNHANFNDFNEIKEKFDGLICVISTKSSKLFEHVNEKVFVNELYKIQKHFSDFYIGLEIYEFEDKSKAKLIREFAKEYEYKIVAFPLIKYLEKEDYEILEILKAIDMDTQIDTVKGEISKLNYLRTDVEIHELYEEDDIRYLHELVSKINFKFEQKRGELLHFTENMDIDSKSLLHKEILDSLKAHGIDLTTQKEYKNRLNKEFLIIDKMGYCDYFLIVQDYVQYARKNGIPVGPGRGSAAGSLIAYLLGITEIDPLKYDDLLFERFLNPERNSMPDIDIDFSDLRRDDVIRYIINKYGQNRTARVIAFQTIGPKQALRDIGRVFHYSPNDIEQLSKAIPSNFNQGNYDLEMCSEKIPAFKNLISDPKNKEIYDKARLIEGFPRQKGLHAAGVIINNKSLLNTLPLTMLDEDTYVTQYEKDYLEEQGFLKMDLLGLTALSTIQRTLDLIKIHQGKTIKLDEIPFDTPEIFELINSKKTMGIFQLDTSAATKAVLQIKPNKFTDVVDLIAIDRPGPTEQIPLYSDRKNKGYKTTYYDESLVPILKHTYGIIIYQEQIMQIARVFAGFSLAEADIFRRAVSKKQTKGMLEMKEKFFRGARKLGRNEKTIENIFDLILKFASYGFNKSHSVAYSVISCRMAYLKANYPLEFYCSILESQYGSNDVKFSKYVAEIKRSKININVPNINESGFNFRIYNKALLMPLSNIGGLPNRVALNIINERKCNGKYKDFLDFVVRMFLTPEKITANQLTKLIDAGAFDELYSNRKSLKESIDGAMRYASTSIYKEGDLLDSFGLSFNYVDAIDDPKERLQNEYDVLGIMISDSPFNHISLSKNIPVTPFDELVIKRRANVVGIIKNVKTITIKKGAHKGEPMAFIDVYDESENLLNVTLFSDYYAIYQNELVQDKIVLIQGRLEDNKKDRPSFILEKIRTLGE